MPAGSRSTGQLRALRRLLYCGEWIESHALHVFMLHAPDFLGYESAIELARDHPELVARALELKKAGNEVMTVVGGREVHPINVRVGGLYRAPHASRAGAARRQAGAGAGDRARGGPRGRRASTSPTTSRTTSSSPSTSPASTRSTAGRIVSNRGLDFAVSRVRRALRGGARRVVERAALAPRERGTYLVRAARALRAHATGCPRSPGRRPPRPVSAVYATRSAASSCARWSSSTRPTRRCAHRGVRGARRARGRAPAHAGTGTAAPRRRAASSTTGTLDATDDPRRPDRAADLAEPAAIEEDLRGVVERYARHAGRGALRSGASRRSATTIRASRARPTS